MPLPDYSSLLATTETLRTVQRSVRCHVDVRHRCATVRDLLIRSTYMSSTIVNIKTTSANSTNSSGFLKTNGSALQDAINQATGSRAQICSKGGLSTATLKKALDGERILISKANSIVIGLAAHGVKVSRDTLFIAAD